MARDFAARRIPRQERGERRVAAILDAAAALLSDVGYDAMTVSAVAAHAHIPIGSVYQFYPNKEAIAQALAERYLAELQARFDMIFTPEIASLPLSALIDHLVDPYVAFVVGHPGFVALLVNSKALKQLPATIALQEELTRRIAALFTARNDALDPVRARLYAELTVQIVGVLASLAIAPDRSIHTVMIGELKDMLRGYLGSRLDGVAG